MFFLPKDKRAIFELGMNFKDNLDINFYKST
jgi:hypothetical protein